MSQDLIFLFYFPDLVLCWILWVPCSLALVYSAMVLINTSVPHVLRWLSE